jgi:hypothetical protein
MRIRKEKPEINTSPQGSGNHDSNQRRPQALGRRLANRYAFRKYWTHTCYRGRDVLTLRTNNKVRTAAELVSCGLYPDDPDITEAVN